MLPVSNNAELSFNGRSFDFRFEKKNGLFGLARVDAKTGNKEVFVGKTWSW